MNLNSPTGIYIHIPFCIHKCNYCNFYSVSKPTKSLMRDYITCLCNEITQTTLNYRLKSQIKTLYLGGGTPNIMPLDQLIHLTRHIGKAFDLNLPELEEATIEINPGLSELSYLKTLRELGFNRVSIGIQSLNNKILNLMRRVHSSSDALDCLETAKKAGFENISCDLIFNYPSQTESMVLSDIKQISQYDPTHFSLYSLSIEPKTILAKQIQNHQLKPGSEEKERETYYKINQLLEKEGFHHYEISNYAKSGYESKQNNLYWSLGSYFGFGPASSSFISNIRIDHPADLKAYLNNEEIPAENIHYLSERELKEDFMYLGLRKIKGINDSDYLNLFGSSFFDDFKPNIERCIDQKYLLKDGKNLKLTTLGIDFADRVALEFLL